MRVRATFLILERLHHFQQSSLLVGESTFFNQVFNIFDFFSDGVDLVDQTLLVKALKVGAYLCLKLLIIIVLMFLCMLYKSS